VTVGGLADMLMTWMMMMMMTTHKNDNNNINLFFGRPQKFGFYESSWREVRYGSGLAVGFRRLDQY
jgi:hypothetical protein